jgi:5'-nucleotidase
VALADKLRYHAYEWNKYDTTGKWSMMQILVTNDDGIDSLGLWHLAAALRDTGLGQVTIIAPVEEQSGTSMSFPPRDEHAIRPVAPPEPIFADIPAFALDGTPVNCVTLAMLAVVAPRPDIIVSGINRGLNSGRNVMLSGTVGAAMAGVVWGVPGLAVSAQYVRDEPMGWVSAAWAATQMLPLMRDYSASEGNHPLILNVNVPHTHNPAELRGFRQTVLSDFFYGSFIAVGEMMANDQGGQRFRYTFDRSRFPTAFDELTDDGAIRAGYVSVTPLTPLAVHPQINLDGLLAILR